MGGGRGMTLGIYIVGESKADAASAGGLAVVAHDAGSACRLVKRVLNNARLGAPDSLGALTAEQVDIILPSDEENEDAPAS